MNKDIITLRKEEETINELLADITLKKPSNIFHIYVREEIKNEIKLENSQNPVENLNIDDEDLNLRDFSKYKNKWDNMNTEEKNVYKKIYEKEYNKYLKELEIVKKYIFKGLDGNITLKHTAYHLYLNDILIEGLQKEEDPKKIKKDAKKNWDKMLIKDKEKYYKQKQKNDTLIALILKYKQINPIIIFSYLELENSKNANKEIPSIDEVLLKWKKLPRNTKKIYENYTDELIILKFKLLNIYYIINGVKPKAPAGALRLFLQIKVKENAISSINEGIKLWENLNDQSKEYYLKLSHNFYLANKYQEMIYNKKINEMIPKKPNLFQTFLSEKKGIKLDKSINTIKYWREKFNALQPEEKEKYNKKYNKNLEKYNKKIEEFNNRIFDLPTPPKIAFIFYFESRLLSGNNNIINVKEKLELIAKEWNAKNVKDKEKYILLANDDKKRYKKQITHFEKFGYYYKNLEKNDSDDNTKRYVKKKRTKIKTNDKKKRNTSRNRKQNIIYGSPQPKRGFKPLNKK